GFAVVQSQTADVFALRLAHSGALVAYRIQPNPDVPKDWNVVPFPLNPRYTKQGTLDGTAGYDERGQRLTPRRDRHCPEPDGTAHLGASAQPRRVIDHGRVHRAPRRAHRP